MALDVVGIFSAVTSHAKRTGLFSTVSTHEPKAPPGNNLTVAVWVQNIAPATGGSGLDETSARLELRVRIYQNWLSQPEDSIDPATLRAVSVLMGQYTGDFELEGATNVRGIDLLGTYGTPLRADAGHIDIAGKKFRAVDITLPIIVNDLWSQGA